jgi:predicted enzyme related to lactoylglutathione lyase
MLKLDDVAVMLDSGNSEELADFYERLLGWEKHKTDDGEWISLLNKSGEGGLRWLAFQEIENYKRPVWPEEQGTQQQQMIHLDFYIDDVAEGVKDALSYGAVLAETQFGDENVYQTLLDPAGHPFCICKSHAPPAT